MSDEKRQAAPGRWRAAKQVLARLARVRLVQFVVLGGALFALSPRSSDQRSIVVNRAQLARLLAADRSKTRTADPDREQAIARRFVEDELLYREGLRLGLDRDDGIVRQRVIQKALFLAEELGGASKPPREEDLT